MPLVSTSLQRRRAGAPQMPVFHPNSHLASIPPVAQPSDESGVVGFVIGAVGWVVDRLYSSGNPQVRAYYQQDPFASPARARHLPTADGD
jgi:hypothetical protein